jgi:hypothetical protein
MERPWRIKSYVRQAASYAGQIDDRDLMEDVGSSY